MTSGEYIQMSGRAGRRGLDDKGIVILMIDEKVSPQEGREIIQGKPDPINSAFHLTYNMVLNLLRVEEINPEYMLERSFFQFQNQAAIPELYQSMWNWSIRNLQDEGGKVLIEGFSYVLITPLCLTSDELSLNFHCVCLCVWLSVCVKNC